MALYGYARVSTGDQDLTLQEHTLRAAGCEVIRAEKVTGTSRVGRTELQVLLDFLRHGDTLMVTRIDRLARSIKDLQDIVFMLKDKGGLLKRQSSLSAHSVRQVKLFWTCWAFSQNLKQTFDVNGSLKALPLQSPVVSTVGVSHQSTQLKFSAFIWKRS